jgi:hypothetical protein
MTQPATQPPVHEGGGSSTWLNPFTLLTDATIAVSTTGSNLQIADTNATIVMGSMLTYVYNLFTPALTASSAAVEAAAANWATHSNGQGGYENAQAAYSQLNTISSNATTQGQSAVSTDQNQAQQDSTNTARIIQLVSAVTQIQQTMGRLLG